MSWYRRIVRGGLSSRPVLLFYPWVLVPLDPIQKVSGLLGAHFVNHNTREVIRWRVEGVVGSPVIRPGERLVAVSLS